MSTTRKKRKTLLFEYYLKNSGLKSFLDYEKSRKILTDEFHVFLCEAGGDHDHAARHTVMWLFAGGGCDKKLLAKAEKKVERELQVHDLRVRKSRYKNIMSMVGEFLFGGHAEDMAVCMTARLMVMNNLYLTR